MSEMEYIRKTYNVPAKIFGRIKYKDQLGEIIGAKGAYLRIKLYGESEINSYHPTYKIEYLDTLRVWWMPQVPSKETFTVTVETPKEAKKILDVLAEYDIYQLKHNIKPDFCNAGGLQKEDGEGWSDWYNEDGETIDEIEFGIDDSGTPSHASGEGDQVNINSDNATP